MLKLGGPIGGDQPPIEHRHRRVQTAPLYGTLTYCYAIVSTCPLRLPERAPETPHGLRHGKRNAERPSA
eukprot:6626955-Prymnesium_polylepis.1